MGKRRSKLLTWGLAAAIISGLLIQSGPAGEQAQQQANRQKTAVGSQQHKLGQRPLHFEPNLGQWESGVRYLARGNGYQLYLNEGEAAMVLEAGSGQSATLRFHWQGGNPGAHLVASEREAGVSNYYIGSDPSRWRTAVPHYSRVAYAGVYDSIDLAYYSGADGNLEYDFIVQPGGNPAAIRLTVDGAERIEVAGGDLLLHTASGIVRQAAARIYQQTGAGLREVQGSYVVRGNEIAFSVPDYDRSLALLIDPVLDYSTYLGGEGLDFGQAIAADSAGNSYTTGATYSAGFPTRNATQPTRPGGSNDAFVTKLITSSGVLTYGYSTYIGGTGSDNGFAIAVDSLGNAYVSGSTNSPDFPTLNPVQATNATSGTTDVFVSRFDSTGARTFGTYLGGNSNDFSFGVGVDASRNIYVAGYTTSANFPRRNSLQANLAGASDAFVTKIISASGVFTYEYSTILGGTSDDYGYALAVDPAGNAYVTGFTISDNFPTFKAVQPSRGGSSDAFVSELVSSGGVLTYGLSTYLGGSGSELLYGTNAGIGVDGQGSIYVTGQTQSSNFPTRNAQQPNLLDTDDAYVTKIITASGVFTYGYSTYLGGGGSDYGYALAVDSQGSAVVAGGTNSNDFPTINPVVPGRRGSTDGFVTKLDATGTRVDSTYLGGSGDDYALGVALDGQGNAYVTGYTNANNFPILNPSQPNFGGSFDGFVSKLVEPINAATNTPANTATNTATATNTPTRTATGTATGTATSSNTATNTATRTASNTASNTATGTATRTATGTVTTGTATATSIASSTATLTATATPTSGPPTTTVTSTASPVASSTATLTATATPTSGSPTTTASPVASSTATLTATATLTSGSPTVTAIPCTISFSDVPTSNIFYGDIQFLACRGIVSGFAGGTFQPNANTTRGQFAKIASLGFALPAYTPSTPSFNDVAASSVFYTFVETAARAGAVNGLNPTQCAALGVASPCYGPNVQISRVQVVVIVQRVRAYTSFTPSTPTFRDVPAGSFGYGAVETLVGRGVISGAACVAPQSGLCFRPNDNIRRGELSKVVRRAIETLP